MSTENNIPQGTPVAYVPEQPSNGIQLQIGNQAPAVEQPKAATAQPAQEEKPWSERIAEARAEQEAKEITIFLNSAGDKEL